MSSITSPSVIVSRPKVHRLPASSARRSVNKLNKINYVVGAVTIIAVGVAFLPFNKQVSNYSDKSPLPVATLPPISIHSQDAAVEEPSILRDATNALSHTIGDAQAAVGTAAPSKKASTIISLHNNSDYIVGQMTKIPVENEQITEIRPANDIDNHAGRELLSIISKY